MKLMLFFFDEYNRAPDKVINATMELIQFGSINGHKLKNLKVIWAAINPEDEEDTYSVNHLDPAHLDRFQVHLDVPYKVDKEYFMQRYPDIGQSFIDWWDDLPTDIRYSVSPRRLDYAADAFKNKCRIEDFLPPESNPKKLRDMLKSLPFLEKLKLVTNETEAITFVSDVNNTVKLLDMIKSSESTTIDFFRKYGAHIPKELQAPFIDYLQAKKEGFEVFDSIEEMIEKIPGDKGTSATGAMINNVDFKRMFAKNGGNIQNDLLALSKTKPHLVKKLSNRISDILLGCTTQTIMRLFWGPQGRAGGKATSLQVISLALARVSDTFTDKQKIEINNKLYRNKIVDAMHFL